jgi:hypothetical protein
MAHSANSPVSRQNAGGAYKEFWQLKSQRKRPFKQGKS